MQQRNDQAHQLPDPPAPAPPPQPGETLTAAPPQAETGAGPFAIGDLVAGRFRVLREIAEGGMGIVYLAEDERLHQRRALKCAKSGYGMHLPPEARSALRVTHPNVCRIFEMHTTETPRGIVDFLAMEYIDGLTLASRLRTHGPPAPQEALAIALQICAGLQAAHDGSLLHRDLKSNNVLLAKDRAGALRAVVMDFGLAQEQPAAGKQLLPADASGTPGYIAPERYHGARASVASDIYALGVVLHELATGRRPAGIKEEPETSAARPDPALRGRWKKVVRRCLQNDPAKRYASAREVASALSGNRTRRQAGLAAAAVALLAVALWTTRPAVTPPARLALFPLEARASNGPTQSLVRGASYDLSNRLVRLRPRPPQLVVIPLEDTRGIRTPEQARARLGATHALLGTVTPQNGRLALRGSVIDTATKVALREVAVDFDQNDAGGLAASMAALVAAVFRLPRQTAPETVAAPAYRDYAEGMSLLRSGTRNFDKAAAALHRAVQLDPRSPSPAPLSPRPSITAGSPPANCPGSAAAGNSSPRPSVSTRTPSPSTSPPGNSTSRPAPASAPPASFNAPSSSIPPAPRAGSASPCPMKACPNAAMRPWPPTSRPSKSSPATPPRSLTSASSSASGATTPKPKSTGAASPS